MNTNLVIVMAGGDVSVLGGGIDLESEAGVQVALVAIRMVEAGLTDKLVELRVARMTVEKNTEEGESDGTVGRPN